MSFLRAFRRDEAGQAIMIVAASMTAMLLAVGLAVDTGQLFVARRTMQEAADAGAYAGAVVVYQNGSSTDALSAATADVTSNGFTNDGTTTVTVRHPSGAPYNGSTKYVEVIITTQVRSSILPAISRELTTVTVRAVAGAEPLNSGYAVISLETGNVQNALQVGLNGNIAITGAGILVNSTNSQAAYNADNDGSNINIDPLYDLDVAGGAVGGWDNQADPGSEQVPNPFAGYPKPSTTGVTVYNAMPADADDGATDNIITIYPGVWNVEIGASGTTFIKMTSGIYVMKQGLNGTGQATICSTATVDPSGTPTCATTNGGVFLFNTHDNYPNATIGDCDNINLNGNGRSVLFPLTSGTYAGMLVYQDENCTNTFSISGNGELEASGTIYLPNAEFLMNGNNATLTGSQVVAETVNVQQGNLSMTFDAGTTAQPVLPRLAE